MSVEDRAEFAQRSLPAKIEALTHCMCATFFNEKTVEHYRNTVQKFKEEATLANDIPVG